MRRMPTADFVCLCLYFAAVHGFCTPAMPPEPALRSVTIGTNNLEPMQSLPLTSIAGWPVWLASEDATAVTCVAGTMAEDEVVGWVNPLTFEQLWLPQGLPMPKCRAALCAVLKNGVPRYLFPTSEATVTSDGGRRLWHNRGLNSMPMGKTWLTFGEVPIPDLRLSAYTQPLPTLNEAEVGSEEAVDFAIRSSVWKPVLPLTSVADAMSCILEVIANGPDELGEGFCYLMAPLKDAYLPEDAIQSGNRIRLFLSDVDATPTSLDPDDRESWVWSRGECDLSLFTTASGRESEFIPEVYKPLFMGKS